MIFLNVGPSVHVKGNCNSETNSVLYQRKARTSLIAAVLRHSADTEMLAGRSYSGTAAGCDVCPCAYVAFSAHTKFPFMHDTTSMLGITLMHGRKNLTWTRSILASLATRLARHSRLAQRASAASCCRSSYGRWRQNHVNLYIRAFVMQ